MHGMIDVHHHVVFGVDDGAKTEADAQAMIERSAADGVAYIIATSHATPSMERFPMETYLRHLDQLNDFCQGHQLDMAIHSGCEIFYSDNVVRLLNDRQLLTLAESRFVLIEFDPTWSAEKIIASLREVANAGYVPVIAHVERYEDLVEKPDLLLECREKFSMRIQMNCSVMIGKMPRRVRQLRDLLMQENALDYVASDAHNVHERKSRMQQAAEEISKMMNPQYAVQVMGGNQLEIFA